MKDTIIRYLLNLFPSSVSVTPDTDENLSYTVKIGRGNKYLILTATKNIWLKREDNFSHEDRALVNNITKTIDNFYKMVINEYYYDDIIERSIDIGVIKSLFGSDYEKYLQLYNKILLWKDRTYENKYVCFGIQIEMDSIANGINLLDVIGEDFIAPIGDGISTFLKVDKDMNLIDTETYLQEDASAYIPIRFSTISINLKSVFIILTRLGDLLIIK